MNFTSGSLPFDHMPRFGAVRFMALITIGQPARTWKAAHIGRWESASVKS